MRVVTETAKCVETSRLREVLRILIIDSSIALVPPVLLVVMTQDVTAQKFLATFGYSLVYSHCIGTLAFLTIRRVWVAFEHSPLWLKWSTRFAVMFVDSVVGGLTACLILVWIGAIPMSLYWPEFLGSMKIATFLTLLSGGIISMYETFRSRLDETTLQLRSKELERERALKLATEAQLASLESRIHPHFLFNTLNSISSLIPEDPARAEKLIEQMAALLRFSMDANQSGLVPLARELKIVCDYLEIERARFGPRLRYRIDVSCDAEESTIPPLSVQTLVENSIKYAIAPSRPGGEIRISGTRENGLLRLEVSDEGPAFTLEATSPGHGLDNLQGRLNSLFGGRAALTLERRENRNTILMAIPQSPNGHARLSS